MFLFQCSTKEAKTSETDEDTTHYEAGKVVQERVDVKGDFNGDGEIETAVNRLIKEGEIQSADWIYTIVFSDPAIQSLTYTSSVEIPGILINEGPLNNIPGDELSIVTQASWMGMAGINVYTMFQGLWGSAMYGVNSKIMLPDSLTFDDLIFNQNHSVFYYEYVISGFGGDDDDLRETGFYKTEAKLYADIESISNRFMEEELIGSMDADGDGVDELMRIVLVAEGEEESELRLEFSEPRIKPMAISSGRCTGVVYVEGELDDVMGSELSVLNCGIMPNYGFMTLFSYVDNRWKKRLDGISIRDILPEGVTQEDIFFREDGVAYYYEDEDLDTLANSANKAEVKKVKIEWK